MNNIPKYKLILLLTLTLLLISLTKNLAIETQELKLFPENKQSSKVLLKGNVREEISHIRPQTGIGVIGLRFIHQTGYPSYIEQVYPNSPAKKAGIKPRDLIAAINGTKTNYLNSDQVFEMLSGKPGTKVRISITRGTTMFDVELIREDLANFPPEVQNRYLSGPISVPFNPKEFFPYH